MLKEKNLINVAEDFSDEPFGRYPEDGPNNATTFRDKHLIPALKKLLGEEKLTIDFTGVPGLGSSFMEEVFGGLIRAGFEPEYINSKIIYKFPLAFYEIQAKKFMAMAKNNQKD